MQENGAQIKGMRERVKQKVVQVMRHMKNKRVIIHVYDCYKLIDPGIEKMGSEENGAFILFDDYLPDLVDRSSPILKKIKLPIVEDQAIQENGEGRGNENMEMLDDIEDLDKQIEEIRRNSV